MLQPEQGNQHEGFGQVHRAALATQRQERIPRLRADPAGLRKKQLVPDGAHHRADQRILGVLLEEDHFANAASLGPLLHRKLVLLRSLLKPGEQRREIVNRYNRAPIHRVPTLH